ncbi:monocarboxylate transporter 10-like, partial [Lampetra fluviatilis]
GRREGGWRSWLVVVAATWCNGSIFGIQNSFGVLFVAMLERFGDREDTSLRFKTAWVGSLSMGVIFLLSPLVSVCSDRFGCCRTAVLGATVAFVGILSSSFSRSLAELYVTYGLLFAGGCSLAYQPSLVILGRHFTARLGLVNGLVTAGSSLFTIVMPLVIKHSLNTIGLAHTLQFMSLFMIGLIMASCTYLPPPAWHGPAKNTTPALHTPHTSLKGRIVHTARTLWEISRGDAAVSPSPPATPQGPPPTGSPQGPPTPAGGGPPRVSSAWSRRLSGCLGVFDWSLWRLPSYCTWALGVPLALFGYFVPYVHLMKHVEERFPKEQGEILLICIGVTSGVGRLVSGRVVDLIPGVNKVFMQVISFVLMGLFSMLLPLCPAWAALIALCLAMGFVDGCFICVMAPVAFELVGPASASQAIGGLLGLMAVPMTAGPPIAGILRDRLGSYDIAFYLAGVPPLLGAMVLSSVPWFHNRHRRRLRRPSRGDDAGTGGTTLVALLRADDVEDPELDHNENPERRPDDERGGGSGGAPGEILRLVGSREPDSDPDPDCGGKPAPGLAGDEEEEDEDLAPDRSSEPVLEKSRELDFKGDPQTDQNPAPDRSPEPVLEESREPDFKGDSQTDQNPVQDRSPEPVLEESREPDFKGDSQTDQNPVQDRSPEPVLEESRELDFKGDSQTDQNPAPDRSSEPVREESREPDFKGDSQTDQNPAPDRSPEPVLEESRELDFKGDSQTDQNPVPDRSPEPVLEESRELDFKGDSQTDQNPAPDHKGNPPSDGEPASDCEENQVPDGNHPEVGENPEREGNRRRIDESPALDREGNSEPDQIPEPDLKENVDLEGGADARTPDRSLRV